MKRLAFLAHRLPYPPDKGERLRAYHEIRALAADFRITVAALAHSPADAAAARGLEGLCEKVLVAPIGKATARASAGWSLLSGRSATAGYFRSRRLERMLAAEAVRKRFDVAVGYCSSMLGALLSIPAAGHVMDLVDVDSAKWAAYAETAPWPKSLLYRLESRRVAALERHAVAACDATLLVSAAESRAMGPTGERALPVGNGVDTDYFRPTETPANATALVFTGTMDYRPNVEGVCWFVQHVWPSVRRAVPNATFAIVGRDPAKAVRALGEVPGVQVTGSVPDVRPYFSNAAAAIAPLLTARGVQNKVLEAMAAGKAVVASGPALAGLDAKAGRDAVRVDTPEQWQSAVIGLLTNAERRAELGRAARICAENRYSWTARMAPLVTLCSELADRDSRLSPHPARNIRIPAETPPRAGREGSSKKTELVDISI